MHDHVLLVIVLVSYISITNVVTFRGDDYLEVHCSQQMMKYSCGDSAENVTGITASLLQQKSNLYKRPRNIGHIEIRSIVPCKEVILNSEVIIFLVILLYSSYPCIEGSLLEGISIVMQRSIRGNPNVSLIVYIIAKMGMVR